SVHDVQLSFARVSVSRILGLERARTVCVCVFFGANNHLPTTKRTAVRVNLNQEVIPIHPPNPMCECVCVCCVKEK
uniref:Uncharacterized protein n=1 Tax=Anopheles minimus TaxID=112268 RepID=A0A182WMT0_9DIPT